MRRPLLSYEINEMERGGGPQTGASLDGSPHWEAIAEKFEGKTPQQCANRFYHMHNRPSKRGKWSEEEDAKLRQAVESNWRSNGRPSELGCGCRDNRWKNP